MEVITICQRKGGSGKTQSALNIGAGLHRQGKRILFIDLDSQGNLTKNLKIDRVSVSAYQVLSGSMKAENVVTETTEGSLIPSSPRLATIDLAITGKGKEYRLRKALEPIQSRYDYCIVDTPPALGTGLINALTASDSALIVCEARQSSIDGLKLLYGTIDAVRTHSNADLKLKGILITRYRARTILSRDMKTNLEAAAKYLKTKVFSTVVRECNAVGEAEASRESIYQYAPRSNAAKDYSALVQEILQREE